jgi:hypothetical protein
LTGHCVLTRRGRIDTRTVRHHWHRKGG